MPDIITESQFRPALRAAVLQFAPHLNGLVQDSTPVYAPNGIRVPKPTDGSAGGADTLVRQAADALGLAQFRKFIERHASIYSGSRLGHDLQIVRPTDFSTLLSDGVFTIQMAGEDALRLILRESNASDTALFSFNDTPDYKGLPDGTRFFLVEVEKWLKKLVVRPQDFALAAETKTKLAGAGKMGEVVDALKKELNGFYTQ
ncbi:MAG TPA: hypothetical protein VF627_11090 [Abditibacterium sp.]|jgi:hypothetical protein